MKRKRNFQQGSLEGRSSAGGIRALLRRRSLRLEAKQRLREALAGHHSWQPAAAGRVIRFTDQRDPFSNIMATQVGWLCPINLLGRQAHPSIGLLQVQEDNQS